MKMFQLSEPREGDIQHRRTKTSKTEGKTGRGRQQKKRRGRKQTLTIKLAPF